ncbi:MAG TPA: GNAT family N-acetyltransferase [Thermoanaerobaculia bacterium]|nr:GNAT family N-acetyltransferase [Thermoanaerobaculia bacterium]
MVSIRRATEADVPALKELIPLSARELSRGFYSAEETESAITHVFGPDSRLIADGTYFVAEEDGRLAGCGGWSRRRTLYGGDQMKPADDPLLDPKTEAARIRAFFVHPAFARRGVGSRILEACVEAARAAGFRRLELAATLPGVPLYAARGFVERERIDVPMPDGRRLPIVRMEREIDAG